MTVQTPLVSSFVPEVEQNALGTLLHGGDFRKVSSFLRSEHFVSDVHRILFDCIAIAFERYGSTSVPIVAKLLPPESAMGFMAQTGETAVSYMTGLREQTLGAGQLERSGKAVVEQWARMKASELGSRMSTAAADPAADASKIIKSMASDLDVIASAMKAGPRRKTQMSIGDATRLAVAEVQTTMFRGNGLTGTTWGLTDVNRLTGGIQRREMTVMGARPSMGKTATALSIGLNCAKAGVGVGFVSLEMGATRLAMRAMTDLAYDWGVKVPYADLITGKVSKIDFDTLMASASADLDQLPLRIEEQAGLTLTDIRVKVERMMEELGKIGAPMGVLIVDYLQLIAPSSRYQGNRNGEITEISGGLREFAKEYDIGVLALSQLSRNVESRSLAERRPVLSDLRDSGSIEQDADTVIFLFREAYYLEREKGKDATAEADRISRLIDVQNKLEFIIAKQRSGPVRTVDLFIDIACSAVRNASRY